MESNGRLSGREAQPVSTNGVDIGIEAGREKGLQKRTQHRGRPIPGPVFIPGRGFEDGYGPRKKRS